MTTEGSPSDAPPWVPGKLYAFPIRFHEANAYVAQYHRHSTPILSGLFSLGVALEGKLVGVAMVARPIARMNDYRFIAEVRRVCSNGVPNACSFLYSRARQIAQLMGYKRILTYTMPKEGGASLRGAGWTVAATTDGGGIQSDRGVASAAWKRHKRPDGQKWRWEASLDMGAPNVPEGLPTGHEGCWIKPERVRKLNDRQELALEVD